jgi:two-component system phosphate regulon response regulator PhoB
MPRESILVVDDEENILELVRFNLSKEGYRVACAATGEEALKGARAQSPDLIVLDLMLPGLDGLEVCKILKRDAKTERIPIVMLTAKGEESDIVTGLELGADDYVTKPFSPKVLIARIRAVLRRHEAKPLGESAVLKVHDIAINPGRHEVLVAGKPAELTCTEFRILHFLARRPGWVFTRAQILDAARGQDIVVTDRSVDVHVVSLRRKLGNHGEYIETVRGIGYRFKE